MQTGERFSDLGFKIEGLIKTVKEGFEWLKCDLGS